MAMSSGWEPSWWSDSLRVHFHEKDGSSDESSSSTTKVWEGTLMVNKNKRGKRKGQSYWSFFCSKEDARLTDGKFGEWELELGVEDVDNVKEIKGGEGILKRPARISPIPQQEEEGRGKRRRKQVVREGYADVFFGEEDDEVMKDVKEEEGEGEDDEAFSVAEVALDSEDEEEAFDSDFTSDAEPEKVKKTVKKPKSGGRKTSGGARGGVAKAKEKKPAVAVEVQSKKMCDVWKPNNNPQSFRMSYKEAAASEFLDPCGQEAHDDVIENIVHDQFLKLGLLYSRSNAPKISLLTACSGTDAPALALQMFEESAQRVNLEFPQEHKMSCEIEAFKQAYIQNNFDPIIYPDIAKLTTTKEDDGETPAHPRDIFGIETPLPEGNFFVAGTVCKNFSMMRGTYRIDIEDRGQSGETFLAAVEVLEKQQPQWTLFENVTGAPWTKMSEYITGRVPVFLEKDSMKKLKVNPTKAKSGRVDGREIKFVKEEKDGECYYVAEDVGGYYGVRPGARLVGVHKKSTGKLETIEPKKNSLLLSQFIKEYNCLSDSRDNTDILVFKKPCTYCTRLVKVDTKDFGLPQTRNRCYLFVYKTSDGNFSDDLGDYYEHLVEHLKSPCRHSLEAFILDEDHEVIRVFREALLSGPGRHSAMLASLETNFWENTNNKDLAHNKSARRGCDFEDKARFTTSWGSNGAFKCPPHWWHEYLSIQLGRKKDMLDILPMMSMRDAEAHDSNFCSFYWNISQNVTREPHRQGTSGVAGCVTPGGDVFLPHKGRCLLGPEKLLLQGIPFFRLRLGNETEVNMSDLAGNAMSLSVVSACMLAAVTAEQFRSECLEEYGKAKAKASVVLSKVAKKVLKKSAVEEDDIMKVEQELELPEESDCMETFKALAEISEEAYSASVLCTSESSGRVDLFGKFLSCKNCGVSISAACKGKYQTEGCKLSDMLFSTPERSDPIAFESTLRSKMPSQLHIPAKIVSEIAKVGKDDHGVSGLENFIFQLSRIKRDRHCWRAFYTAKQSRDSVKNVAQIILKVGSLECASKDYGMTAYLYCYQPTLEHKKPGRIGECLRLVLPKKASSANWEIREVSETVRCKLVGSSPVDSTRIKMGIKSVAGINLKNAACQKKPKARDLKESGELGRRRWEYAEGWEKWPKVIQVGDGENPNIDGEYEKLDCILTAPHSALWRRKGTEAPRYILLLPEVSRIGPDCGIISSSPNADDKASIILKLSPLWQPSDPLQKEMQEVKGCTLTKWRSVSKDFSVSIPHSTITVEIGKHVKDPNPNDTVTIATIKDLDQHTVEALKRHYIGSDGMLNLYDGVDGMKTARTFTATCAPALQQVAEFNYSLDDRDNSAWYPLTPGKSPRFGHDEEILPTLPKERWYHDKERSDKNGGKKDFYSRRPDPVRSKEFKEKIKDRPHGWEAYLKNNDVIVNIKPNVLAQLSAHALIADRGLGNSDGVEMHYRLSNIRTQADPDVSEFRIQSTNKEKKTEEWGFKKGFTLYPRQKQGLTRLLAIEAGERIYVETEMSEKELPGTGFTLATKASRRVPLQGGVIADAIGAGKTVISIALILKGLEAARKQKKVSEDLADSAATLVVVPPGLITQWKDEFMKFVDPSFNLKIICVFNLETLQKLTVTQIAEADVVICPVDILEGDCKAAVKNRAKYLRHLFEFTVKNVDAKYKKEVVNDQYDLKKAPVLPTTWGAKENIGVGGIWVANSSADPYGQGASASQQKRDDCGFFTDRYSEIIDILRTKTKIYGKTKGVPLEFFRWERVFVDEIHESLCTTRADIDDSEFSNDEFHTRNRGAAREFLGIAQHDTQKRPLRTRGSVFGLTGTPLLDSENRVIELANLMGGTYITSQRSHWRKCERESGRDSFIALWLEPQRSRMYRRERHSKAEEWLLKGSQRDVAAKLKVACEEIKYQIAMSEESGKQFLASTPNAINNFNTMPPDFDRNAGQDPTAMLKCNAGLTDRKDCLKKIVADVQENEPGTKILVFADTKFGAYQAACEAMGEEGATFKLDEDDNESWNDKLSFYKTTDVTEEDKKRPRVLILTFEECAGLNLQTACHHVILYAPMYSVDDDLVKDCSTELQAIGRVYRTGQVKDVTVHRILVYPPTGPKENEKTLDDWIYKRNTSEEVKQKATNAEE